MAHAIGLVLVALGSAVVVTAASGALLVRGDMFLRLHFVTPVTSLGAPLVGVGLCVESGQPWVVAEVLVIVALLFACGPVLEASAARAAGQRKGLLTEGQPE